MGMAASQVNLLAMISRKADIEYQEQGLALQKEALTRDMQKVTRKYKESINQKTFKWTNDGGVNYIDMNYKNLMHPCMTNQETPYVVTDLSGKVVVDSRYKEYAEMISADGGTGNWEDARSYVLSQLTGIDEDKIEEFAALEKATFECQYVLEHIEDTTSEEYTDALKEFEEAQDAWNAIFTNDVESKIKFYDQLFQAIADCGWTYNNNVNDDDYLNQMFQNGMYTITTINSTYNENGEFSNSYTTDITSNCSHAVLVNDSTANSIALSDYEYQKSIINSKEKRIDERMSKLETEIEAINQMMQGVEQVSKDNIDTHFNIFG